MISSYGHLLDVFQALLPNLSISRGSFITLLIWITLIGLWFYFVLRKLKSLAAISNYLNIIALVLNIFPIYSIATFPSQTADIASVAQEFIEQNRLSVDDVVDGTSVWNESERRDIYFIVLDAYAREDVLDELYDYDNSEFVEFLRSRGFFVDQGARTNYVRSEYSIASSLNMMHINNLPEFLRLHDLSADEETIRQISQELIWNSLIPEIVRDQGYQIVTFDNGFGATQFPNANIGLYRDQVHYLNSLVMKAIDEILQKSSRTPIIILQADHGSKVYSDIDPPINVKMDLQLPILSASLLPDASEDEFDLGFTPVNNFRRVLDLYAGSSLELLENTSYLLEERDGRTEFIDACEKYKLCSYP